MGRCYMIDYIKKMSVPQIIVGAYSILILVGAILLSLPISSAEGIWTSSLDAFFSSTSAVTVTGVTILDTATYWSFFGKTVLLFLIEIGGLGFMSIWVLFYQNLIGRPNLKSRMVMSESFDLTSSESVTDKVWAILRFALVVQAAGAILLGFYFMPIYGIGRGSYLSIFHSVSAFTNGGLDLFSTSLLDFQTNEYVLIVSMLLIITGGLGFIVWDEILNYRKKKKLSIYTKVVLITTGSLHILGTLFYWLSERNTAAFADLDPGHQFLNYLMLSVTVRSSGFTNIDFTHLSFSSLILTNFLIFIGASSGSTGGGIKVTTLAVIVITIVRFFQGRKPTVFNRTLSDDTVKRAFFIFTIAAFLVVAGTFALSITETLPEGIGSEYIVTEVVSALGSVGISMGLTPHLTVPGKFIIIILMIIGRVGILTFLWSIIGDKRESRLNYPKVNFLVG